MVLQRCCELDSISLLFILRCQKRKCTSNEDARFDYEALLTVLHPNYFTSKDDKVFHGCSDWDLPSCRNDQIRTLLRLFDHAEASDCGAGPVNFQFKL